MTPCYKKNCALELRVQAFACKNEPLQHHTHNGSANQVSFNIWALQEATSKTVKIAFGPLIGQQLTYQ